MKTTAKKAAPKKSVITRMRERSIDRIVQGVDAISERLSLIESSVAVIRSEHMNDEVERASSHAYDAWNECRAISVTLNKMAAAPLAERMEAMFTDIMEKFQHMREEVDRASARAHHAQNECRGMSVTLNRVESSVHSHGSAIATAIDRIVQRLTAIESSVAVIRPGAAFMQELKETRDRDEWPTRTTLLTMALALNDEDYQWLRKQMAKIPEQDAPDLAAKEREEKVKRLVFGAKVSVRGREGVYHFNDGDSTNNHWVVYPDGEENHSLHELTLID